MHHYLGTSLPTLVVNGARAGQSRTGIEICDVGGAGSVWVVVILKWAKDSARQVKGDIEVFDLDPLGNVRTLQQEIIFPVPPTQNPAQVIDFDVNKLRQIADRYMMLNDSLKCNQDKFTRGNALRPAFLTNRRPVHGRYVLIPSEGEQVQTSDEVFHPRAFVTLDHA